MAARPLPQLLQELTALSKDRALHLCDPSVPSPDGTSFLLQLPGELIAEIFKSCDVADHFNLALTCRRLVDGGEPTLARHRAAARDYGLVTDWNHLTIQTVLNKVIEDPYVRYNIRRIEIYGTRYEWSHWGEFRAQPPPTVESLPTPPPEDVMSPTFEGGDVWYDFRWEQVFDRPTWQEIWGPGHAQIGPDFDEDPMTYAMLGVKRSDEYLPTIIRPYYRSYVTMMTLLGWFSHTETTDEGTMVDDASWAETRILSGNDSLLKALLICLCPRLNILRHASCNLDGHGAHNLEVMDRLRGVITRDWRQNTWAPGLKSLREVSIGVPTGLWYEDRNLSGFHGEHVVRSIMLLPSLKTVYFGTINLYKVVYHDAEHFPPRFEDLTGCSSVENIFVDQFMDEFDEQYTKYSAEKIMEFLLVPKKLKNLTIRGGIDRQLANRLEDQTLYMSMLHLRKHLTSVVEYNCRLRPTQPTWHWFSRNNQVRRLYQQDLNIITISAVKLVCEALPWMCAELGEPSQIEDSPDSHPRFTRYVVFPRNVEVILIQKNYLDDGAMSEAAVLCLESQLVEVVRRNDGVLKAIYIEQQVNPNDGKIDEWKYLRLINVGKREGVDIHVKGNDNVKLYQPAFPVPPPMSKAVGEEDGEQVFDPFMGRRTRQT